MAYFRFPLAQRRQMCGRAPAVIVSPIGAPSEIARVARWPGLVKVGFNRTLSFFPVPYHSAFAS